MSAIPHAAYQRVKGPLLRVRTTSEGSSSSVDDTSLNYPTPPSTPISGIVADANGQPVLDINPFMFTPGMMKNNQFRTSNPNLRVRSTSISEESDSIVGQSTQELSGMTISKKKCTEALEALKQREGEIFLAAGQGMAAQVEELCKSNTDTVLAISAEAAVEATESTSLAFSTNSSKDNCDTGEIAH